MISDGGSEFGERFAGGLEHCGVMHHVCDADSPWQNGRVERHGGWVKDRVEQELDAGSSLPGSLDELDELDHELFARKNRFWHRGGFSPAQLVFGQNPRLPHDILSDDAGAVPGWRDMLSPASEQDSAGAEFARSQEVRAAARRLAIEANAHEKISRASKARAPALKSFTPGQW
eukprot:1163374-Pyramimonas_sp.AAC.1